MTDCNLIIYTIGHSNQSIDSFVNTIEHFGIELLVDVRSIPKSKHNPQFNSDNLKQSLENIEVKYLLLKDLGGFRHTQKDSVNTGWKNKSFQGYADYMQTTEFKWAIDLLIDKAQYKKTTIMCAEALPQNCHRSLIADALVVKKVTVEHIISINNYYSHLLTGFINIKGDEITYPLL